MCCADDIAWLRFNIYNASSQRPNCHPLIFIYKFASFGLTLHLHILVIQTVKPAGDKKRSRLYLFYDLPGRVAVSPAKWNPGDPGGKPLPGHNVIYCSVSLLAQHFCVFGFIRNTGFGFMSYLTSSRQLTLADSLRLRGPILDITLCIHTEWCPGHDVNCIHILLSLVASCTDVSWGRPVNVSSYTVISIYESWSYLI